MAAAQTVIAVVDDDPALCSLLAELLEGPSRVVEQVVGAAGLTAELLALARPRLVLLNPRIRGVTLKDLREVLKGTRALVSARFVLMVSEEDARADLPGLLGADEEIPIAVLLRDPLRQLALSLEAPRPPKLQPVKPRAFSALSPEEILAMDLGSPDEPPLPGPAPRSGDSALRSSSVAANLGQLIDDELGAPQPAREHRFEVSLDTVSEHNLVVDGWKQVEGLFVSTLFPPALGDRVAVRVTFPWGAVTEARGTASWTASDHFRRKRVGVGITLELSDEFRALATRFLALRQPAVRPH